MVEVKVTTAETTILVYIDANESLFLKYFIKLLYTVIVFEN